MAAALAALALGLWADRQEPPSRPAFLVTPADARWYAGLPREPEAATRAYLDRIPDAQRARGDALVTVRI